MAEKPNTYIRINKKLFNAMLVSYIVLFIGIVASFQYTNYVDRRSNQVWCGIVTLFNTTYDKVPPPTETGKILSVEFEKIGTKYKCK